MEMTRTSGGCRVILVRHAHTGMAGRFCGQSDPPLDEIGREQLTELANKLERYPITRIFSSDLLRARQTAEPIARRLNLDVRVLSSLREIGFGRWEGMDWAAIAKQDSVYAQRWADSFPALPAPEGEEFEDFRRRIRDAMDVIADQTGEGCTVVITHGGVIRTFLRDALRMSTSEYRHLNCDYTSCWELRREGASWSGIVPERAI
jgi:alpha-ribazole phosphatase/probable phosphoglycerate mutase